jgi:tetratricopeptide (TPR) repeat protein
VLQEHREYLRSDELWFLWLAVVLSLLSVSLCARSTMAATCEVWAAKVVSVQGTVQVKKKDEKPWRPLRLDDLLCPGDEIRVQQHSRAALVLRNETFIRLDERTTVTFPESERAQPFLLGLVSGVTHFFSHLPRSLNISTPFVNAGVEGTEFVIEVEANVKATLTVIAGRVRAGNLTLVSGQAAEVTAGKVPARIEARIRSAVQWALYYPPVLDYRPADFPDRAGTGWQAMVRRSLQFYRQGDLPQAFASLAQVPPDIRDPRFFSYRAALSLTVGQVDAATRDIDRALKLDASHGRALALRAVVALVQYGLTDEGEEPSPLQLAEEAVRLEPTAAAWVALSYVQQAHFNLPQALASLQEAVRLQPDNALAWARLAELRLATGALTDALRAARRAVSLNPRLARTQTVLGFALLTQIKVQEAIGTFKAAIELDQAAPLPRLGLGLALIRRGELAAGRQEIAIAAGLDPRDALIRSYLGKVYYETKHNKLAAKQLARAKELDPNDPTPWFYDAIRKQSVNRPVAALRDLQKSIELNDNRAVYRSRLLLDQDLAARSAALARIYDNLGFQQLALVEGWKSLNVDPSNYSAHRFLADSYAGLPRHEIARVSELLQSQLLQPLNITPVQPRLAESDLLILSGAGPAEASFNEYNPLFMRNRLAFQVSLLAGENDTWGDEVTHAGIWGRLSYSIGQFHYQTDGFRANHDLEQDIYNAFVQLSLSYRTSVQAEFRYTDTSQGDRDLRFTPGDFLPNLQQDRMGTLFRVGFHHAFSPRSDLIASVIYNQVDSDLEDVLPFAAVEFGRDEAGVIAEFQHLFRLKYVNFIAGVGHVFVDRDEARMTTPMPPLPSTTMVDNTDIRHTNVYVYTLINYPHYIIWTLGGSADFFEGVTVDTEQFNPKFGVTWHPFPATTVRAAVFRVLKRTLISDQTLEPTQVAGFNQFFDDGGGTESWRYGLAVDQKFSASLYGGVEFSKRDLRVPFVFDSVPPASPVSEVRRADWEEYLLRTYLYWTPHPWLATRAEFQYEKFDRDEEFVAGVAHVETYRLPLGINLYHPSGFIARLGATYDRQKGRFQPQLAAPGMFVSGQDDFWVVDAAIGFRLPRRLGLVSIEVRNLFDESFRFQDTDPANPTIQPERFVFGRFTLAF